ncbi:hypothetical protein TGP89_421200 [Toxoplasma gondii p89]|uniref:Uncharacterized protein n=1 Tax=Toxoplasma gondii p89 TaxID=943119 RepID=A0A086JA48_TOXGO|nr:hypothetical protein TGP89_421200 [Toxoplasma gondii p89]
MAASLRREKRRRGGQTRRSFTGWRKSGVLYKQKDVRDTCRCCLCSKEAEIESSADAERLLKLQIAELEKERKSLEGILRVRREEIRESFGVLIEAATSEIECTKLSVCESVENLAGQRDALQAKEAALQKQLAAAVSQLEAVKKELEFTTQDPERLRIQADQFAQVLQALKTQTAGVEQELDGLTHNSAAAAERLKVCLRRGFLSTEKQERQGNSERSSWRLRRTKK